jgi:hypothetical protein
VKVRFCTLHLDKELADAIVGAKALEKLRTDYEKEFRRPVSKSELVTRILYRYAKTERLLPEPPK